jgi:mRNA-degrading endonuclease toxin of MazEF toxin-antitoxin module
MSAGTTYSAGDVLLADVTYTDEEQHKRRPILVVSTESYNRATDNVIFVPITSNSAPLGDYHRLELESGHLPFESNVIVDRIQTVRQSRVVKKFGRGTPEIMAKILRGAHALIARP